MGHPIHKIKAFEIAGPYRLRIEFGDGVVRTIDFRPILEGELYGPLSDLNRFNSVALDREVHTLVWPNGADFDPAIQLRCTTGPNTKRACSPWPAGGQHRPAPARRPANFRIQVTAGDLRTVVTNGRCTPAAPDPARSPTPMKR